MGVNGNLEVSKINGSDVTNGVATLDLTGCVPLEQINPAILKAVLWRGTFDAENNVPHLESAVGRSGDMYAVSVPSENAVNLDGIVKFNVGDILIFNGDRWQVIRDKNTIISINGRTGVVTLAKADVGLSLVDNTPDASKPISDSVYAALNGKVDKVVGYGLSKNDFRDVDRDRLYTLQNFSGRADAVNLETTEFRKNLNLGVTDVQKLAQAVDNLDMSGGTGVPTGTVFYTLAPNIPTGYLELDGRQIYEEQDYDLFQMFKKTVNSQWVAFLPDVRGQFIRSANTMNTGVDANRPVGSFQSDQLQGHGHQMNMYRSTRGSGGERHYYSSDASTGLTRHRETVLESLMLPTTIGQYGTAKIGVETRPTNIAMRAIIKR